MMRWDIINHLIKENNYKSYLEIGYYKGWSFDRIQCNEKRAVDPNPSKTPEQEKLEYGKGISTHFVPNVWNEIFKMTSDEFFDSMWGNAKYDIIFIDGLHESSQVDRDIQNSLKHLNPGGTIVMHDCNPSSYEMTTTGTVNGEWTGNVYNSFCKYRALHMNETYVVDTDYGVGIIKTTIDPKFKEKGMISVIHPPSTWEQFIERREEYLNLISPEEFLKKETNVKTTTDNLSTAQ